MGFVDLFRPHPDNASHQAEAFVIDVERFADLERLVEEVYIPADDELLEYMVRAHQNAVSPPGTMSLGSSSVEHQLFRQPHASRALGRIVLGYYTDPAIDQSSVAAVDIVGNVVLRRRDTVIDPSREYAEYWARLTHKALLHDYAHAIRPETDMGHLTLGDRLDVMRQADAILAQSLHHHDLPRYQ